MSGLQTALIEVAKQHQGRFVSHRDVLVTLLKVPPDAKYGDPVLTHARGKLYYALAVLEKKGTITIRRVPYDIRSAQEKIRTVGLPEALAARLATAR